MILIFVNMSCKLDMYFYLANSNIPTNIPTNYKLPTANYI